MTGKNKKKLLKYVIEFIKLQLSGNILFWGTYFGFFLLHELAHWGEVSAIASASILSHILFFVVNKEWVFNDKTGKRKTGDELVRFIVFMGLNFFINLGIVSGLSYYFDISPYIGQFVAAVFFTIWSFIGLRFWVFQEVHHHALTTKYVKEGKLRRAKRTSRRRNQAK